MTRTPYAKNRCESTARYYASRRYAFVAQGIGGNISSGGGIMLQGAWDQRGGEHVRNWQIPIPLSSRNDAVLFQSDPLEEDMEVTGEIEVNSGPLRRRSTPTSPPNSSCHDAEHPSPIVLPLIPIKP